MDMHTGQIQLFNDTAPAVSPSKPVEEINSTQIKHFNDLIIAQHEMNLYERRIFIKLLENLPQAFTVEQSSAIAIESIWIDAREIIEGSGLLGQSAFSELKKATAELIKHICKIEDERRFLQISLLSSAEYHKGQGKIEVRIDPKLLPYLRKLKADFDAHQLSELMQFQSRYSQCLYELLKRESKYRTIIYIDLPHFRHLLGIETIYERYNDVKRKVIQQAQKDLLPYPDVSFTFKEKKIRGKVMGLFFYLKQNLATVPETPL